MGTIAEDTLQAIRYTRGQLELLDQRRLPLDSLYIDIPDSSSGWHAIQDMVVRGAPAIAIAAALSLAVEVENLTPKPSDASEAVKYLHAKLDYLVSSRPTTVNLSDAATKLKEIVDQIAAATSRADLVFK